jgi:hypothetical protein
VLIGWDHGAHGIWWVLTKEEKEASAPPGHWSVRSRLTSKRSADGQIGCGGTPDLSDQLQLPRTTDRLVTVGRG